MPHSYLASKPLLFAIQWADKWIIDELMVGLNGGMWVREIAAPLDHPGLIAATDEACPIVFQGSFPFPVEHGLTLVCGRCSWYIQAVSRLRADACSSMQWESWPPHGSIKVLPWAHGRSLLNFQVDSCRNLDKEKTLCVWLTLQYAAGQQLGCPHPGDQKCFWIHQFRLASGLFYSGSLVWPWESPLSRFKTHEPHLTLVCISHWSSSHSIHMMLLEVMTF